MMRIKDLFPDASGSGRVLVLGELLLDFAASLSDREFDATYYRLINIPDCPFILAFQKRR